jgi:hypothetical protein
LVATDAEPRAIVRNRCDTAGATFYHTEVEFRLGKLQLRLWDSKTNCLLIVHNFFQCAQTVF